MAQAQELQLYDAVTNADMGIYVFGGEPQNGDQIIIDDQCYIIQRTWNTAGLLYLELVKLHQGEIPV